MLVVGRYLCNATPHRHIRMFHIALGLMLVDSKQKQEEKSLEHTYLVTRMSLLSTIRVPNITSHKCGICFTRVSPARLLH